MRTVFILGVAWFVAADVCRVLGIKNPTDALLALDEDEKSLGNTEAFSGGGYGHNLISESGLYALILRSRKPAAAKFRFQIPLGDPERHRGKRDGRFQRERHLVEGGPRRWRRNGENGVVRYLAWSRRSARPGAS